MFSVYLHDRKSAYFDNVNEIKGISTVSKSEVFWRFAQNIIEEDQHSLREISCFLDLHLCPLHDFFMLKKKKRGPPTIAEFETFLVAPTTISVAKSKC